MGRIKIGEERPCIKQPDVVLHRHDVLTGEEVKGQWKESSRITPVAMELPKKCPRCRTEDKVVNYIGSDGKFRCLVCEYKWG